MTPHEQTRHDLTIALVNHIYDGMSLDDVHEFVCEHLYSSYSDHTDEELLDEVREYAPHLIDEEGEK